MEAFIADFLKALLSQQGLVGVLLFLALYYQSAQLNQSRKNNDKLNADILKLATGQISAMSEVQNTLKKVVELTSRRAKNAE